MHNISKNQFNTAKSLTNDLRSKIDEFQIHHKNIDENIKINGHTGLRINNDADILYGTPLNNFTLIGKIDLKMFNFTEEQLIELRYLQRCF